MALNNPNTLAVSAPPPPDRTISYQADSSTQPSGASKDDLLLVTSDGTRDGEVLEQWIFDGVAWVKTYDSESGGVVVSGSIIDNTIANPDLITVPGRYIVPAGVTTGAFVGQENNYAEWYGEVDEVTGLPVGFVFISPQNGDKVVITAGDNAGKIFSYNGSAWTQEAGTASIPSSGQSLAIVNGATFTGAGTNSAWVNVNGGQFTIPGAGRWNIEYKLSYSSSTTNWNQARLVSSTGVLINGSVSSHAPDTANSPDALVGFAQIDTTAAATVKLQARTFNSSVVTVRNISNSNVGQSIIRWTKAVDFPVVAVAPNIITTQNYVSAIHLGGDQTGVTANTDLILNTQAQTAGTIVYDPATGVFGGLKAGKTYRLAANFTFSLFSNTTGGFIGVNWYNAATNVALPNVAGAVTFPVTRTTSESPQNFAGGYFTAPSDMTVKLRVRVADGTASLRGAGLTSASIEEVTGVALDPALIPVNDQTNSGFFDIGNMRIQTGRDEGGNAGTRTITLPAPFANTNYRVAYGADYNADNLVRSGNTVAKTTTSFTARVQHQQGGSATAFDWIAIGRKP